MPEPEAEGVGVHAPGRHAEAGGHRPVLGDAAHEQPSRVRGQQASDQPTTTAGAKTDDHDPVPRQRRGWRTAGCRPTSRTGFSTWTFCAPNDGAHRLDQDQADAPGREQRLQRPPVEEADDAALERHADQRSRGRRRPAPPPPGTSRTAPGSVAAEQVLDHVGRVGADHDQLAVRHVDDAHQPVGDGEPQRSEQQHAAEAHAAEDAPDHLAGGEAAVDRVQRHFRLGAQLAVLLDEFVRPSSRPAAAAASGCAGPGSRRARGSPRCGWACPCCRAAPSRGRG